MVLVVTGVGCSFVIDGQRDIGGNGHGLAYDFAKPQKIVVEC